MIINILVCNLAIYPLFIPLASHHLYYLYLVLLVLLYFFHPLFLINFFMAVESASAI